MAGQLDRGQIVPGKVFSMNTALYLSAVKDNKEVWVRVHTIRGGTEYNIVEVVDPGLMSGVKPFGVDGRPVFKPESPHLFKDVKAFRPFRLEGSREDEIYFASHLSGVTLVRWGDGVVLEVRATLEPDTQVRLVRLEWE